MNTVIPSILMITVLTGLISIDTAYAADYASSPFQQQRDGVPLDAIECNTPRELYIRGSSVPLCLYPSSYDSLSEYGMDLVPSDRSYTDILNAIDSIQGVGEDEVQYIVRETIRMYESDPENAFANIDMLSDNVIQHYPFVLDGEAGVILAHGASQERVGDPSQILGNYADRHSDEILKDLQENDGTWVEYVFLDPISNADRLKKSWLVQHDGYIFGAGYYYSIQTKLEQSLDNAIALYESGGLDAINALSDDPKADLLAVIDISDNDTFVANTKLPELVGTSINDLGSTRDLTVSEAAEFMADGKRVVRYFVFLSVVSGEDGQLRNEYRLHDGYVFTTGYYYPAEEKVQRVVKNTIALYNDNKDTAFDSVNAMFEVHDPHYPFILDINSGMIMANGAFPDVVGTQSVILGGYADIPAEDIAATLLEEGSIWVQYTYPIPGTDHAESKRSYLQYHEDGYIFGSGYYLSLFTAVLDTDAPSDPN